MVTLTHILSEVKWKRVCSHYAFSPSFFEWVPDVERTFDWMLDTTAITKWISGRRVGWLARKDEEYFGFIWGDLEEDVLTINICFDEGSSGKDKVKACRLAEDEARELGVAEVLGQVCIENKRSLAFIKYLGYKRKRKVSKVLRGADTDYYEINKVL